MKKYWIYFRVIVCVSSWVYKGYTWKTATSNDILRWKLDMDNMDRGFPDMDGTTRRPLRVGFSPSTPSRIHIADKIQVSMTILFPRCYSTGIMECNMQESKVYLHTLSIA